jgi:uncharacterized protein (TIGR02246 family)
MATAAHKIAEENDIRNLLDEQAAAIRAKDAKAALANVAPDVLFYDLVDPLRSAGLEAMQKRLDEWLSSFEGDVNYEVIDLKVVTDGDVGFAFGLAAVRGLLKDRRKLEMSWRVTYCCQKLNGKWLITHEHSSVPFNMETGKASLDLKP